MEKNYECIETIKNLETMFSENHYDGSGMKDFLIESGNIPVMVSAPHSINHFRDGEIKRADIYTGGIARYLHQRTGCHLICSSKYSESDPNYDVVGKNKYQMELKQYVEKHKITFLLDIHGAAKQREYAVELGTAPEKNSLSGFQSPEDPSLHEYQFIAKMIKDTLEDKFKFLSTEKNKVWKNRIFSYCPCYPTWTGKQKK